MGVSLVGVNLGAIAVGVLCRAFVLRQCKTTAQDFKGIKHVNLWLEVSTDVATDLWAKGGWLEYAKRRSFDA